MPESTIPKRSFKNPLLTDEQVVEIRAIYASGGVIQMDLARRYGVSRPLIAAIVCGTARTRLPGSPKPMTEAERRARRRNIPRVCLTCGKDFFAFRRQIKTGHAKYCSHRCAGKGREYPSLEERFWAKVDKSPGQGPTGNCWLWTGASYCREGSAADNRHGSMGTSDGKTEGAHRVSWRIHKGPIPDGLFVCHECDFGMCVNPDHLFLDTNEGNMRDRWQKARYFVFLPTPKDLRIMRELRDIGTSFAKIAKVFGFSTETIRKALMGARAVKIGHPAPLFDGLGVS